MPVSDRRDAVTAVPYPLRVAAAISWRALVVAGALALLAFVLVQLRLVAIPVAVAILLTALLGPLVDGFERHRVPRGLATGVVLLAGLAGVGGVMFFVIQAFLEGLPELRVQVSQSLAAIRDFLNSGPFGLPPIDFNQVIDRLSAFVVSNRATLATGVLSTARSVGEFLVGTVLTVFATVTFLYGGDRMWRFLIRVVPARSRDRVDVAGQRSFASLVGYVRSVILIAVVDAVGIGIGLIAVGAPLVVPLTALIFLGAFIPVVGAVVSGVVAVLVVLVAEGLVPALIVLGVVLVVQQLEGNVLQPLIAGRAVQLNALAVVLAVAVGSVLAGIVGALLAVPVLASLKSGIGSLLHEDPVAPERVDADDPDAAEPAAQDHRDADGPEIDGADDTDDADGADDTDGASDDQDIGDQPEVHDRSG